jgi:hypothetical protein
MQYLFYFKHPEPSAVPQHADPALPVPQSQTMYTAGVPQHADPADVKRLRTESLPVPFYFKNKVVGYPRRYISLMAPPKNAKETPVLKEVAKKIQ